MMNVRGYLSLEKLYYKLGGQYFYLMIIFSRFFPSLLGGLLTIYYIQLAQTPPMNVFYQFEKAALFFIVIAVIDTAIIHILRTQKARQWTSSIRGNFIPSDQLICEAYREVTCLPYKAFIFEAIWLPCTIPVPCAIYLYFTSPISTAFLNDILIGGCLGIFTTISFSYFLHETFMKPVRKALFKYHSDFDFSQAYLVKIKYKVLFAFIIFMAATAVMIGVPASNKLWLVIQQIPEELSESIATLRFHIVFISLVAVIIACFLSILLTRSISMPIQEMVLITQKVKEGDFSVRAMSIRDDELGILGHSLNKMVIELEKNKNEILSLNQGLEQKVKDRTQELEHTLDELKKAEAQLVQSAKMASIGQLAAGVAHEINNPVSAAGAALHQLEKDYGKMQSNGISRENFLKDLISEAIPIMKTGLFRIDHIVKALRNFSRKDRPGVNTSININTELDQVLLLLNSRMRDRIEVAKEYKSAQTIACNGGDINQVFMNIIGNAIEAIGEKEGQITIKTEDQNHRVKVTISDTGHGMSEETQGRVFEPFYTTKGPQEGTGLGLAISYEIIKNHGGEIGVTSEIGKGTEFTILIPDQNHSKRQKEKGVKS